MLVLAPDACCRVLRVVSLCLGLQSPVVISADCNYLLPAVQWRPTGYFLKSFCLSFLPVFPVGNLPFLGRAIGIALPGEFVSGHLRLAQV